MSDLSDYLEQKILNATLRGTNLTAPAVADLHMALFTADPTDTNITTNEVSATWYVRKTTGSWTSPADAGNGATESTNTSPITFDSVTDAAITISHIGIYDASTAGNLLYFTALDAPKTLDIGDVISFATGAVSVQLD